MIKFVSTVVFLSISLFSLAQTVSIPHIAKGELSLPESTASSIRLADASSQRRAPESKSDGEWTVLGEGTYKDILFSDLFGFKPQTFKVTFEQNVSDPDLYRIPNVYENMDFSQYEGSLFYDASKATPMEFHVFRGEYAYFEEFDTGVRIDYTNGVTSYAGEVHMLMQGVDLLLYNDIETLAYYLPECLMEYRKGNFTLGATFNLEGRTWNNVLGLVFVTGTSYDPLFKANTKGDFFVSLPEATEYDPNEDWEDIGMAMFTDVFTEGLYSSAPVYSSWEVPMQKNYLYKGRYRLVNPYAGWRGSIPGITYDDDNNYYMELLVQDYDGFSLVGIPTFYTGLTREGTGGYAISNQAADVLDEYDFLTLYYNFPGCLGTLENGVITYPSHCVIEYEYYQNFYGYFGAFDYNGTFYSANGEGNFKIVMPADGSGVEKLAPEEISAPEFYNLQGIKVSNPSKGEMLVKKQGEKSTLIIY